MTTLQQDTDEIVKKYEFDSDIHYYGTLGKFEDDEELVEDLSTLEDFLEQGMSKEYITKLHLMREMERELTLREDK